MASSVALVDGTNVQERLASKHLVLKGLQLTAYPVNLPLWELCERLDLSQNALTSLPDSVGDMANLKLLSLSHNQLRALPAALGLLVRLETLHATHNQLGALPDAIGNCASLKFLNVSNNAPLQHLPGTLLRLPQLEAVYCDACSLPPAPRFVSYREGVKHKDLANVIAICEQPSKRAERLAAPPLPPLVVPPPVVAVKKVASAATPAQTTPTQPPELLRALEEIRAATDPVVQKEKTEAYKQLVRAAALKNSAPSGAAARAAARATARAEAAAAPAATPIDRLFPSSLDEQPRLAFRAALLRTAAQEKMLPTGLDRAALSAMLDALVDNIDLDGSGVISRAVFEYALNGEAVLDWLRRGLTPAVAQQPTNAAAAATAPTAAAQAQQPPLSQRRIIRAAALKLCDGDSAPKVLGKGGFGTVTKQLWVGGPFDVAVKTLSVSSDDAAVRALFEREALLQADLMHDNVLPIYGVVVDGPHLQIVMPLMACSLFDAIHVAAHRQFFSLSEQARIAADTAAGLNYLHTLDPPILHRDMKSLNVMLTARNDVKLADFGLADVKQQIQQATASSQAASSGGLAVGAVGTIQWQAPELFRLKPAWSPAADVYALGVIAWELVAREIPFSGCSPFVIPGAVVAGERPAMPESTPAPLAALIRRCWAQEAQERPSALEAVRAFRALTSELPRELQETTDSPSLSSSMQLESRAPTMQSEDDW
jgi:hypothetical protein